MSNDIKRILIIQTVMKQYRKPLFDRLYKLCSNEGLKFNVVYSAPNKLDKKKADNVDLPHSYGKVVRSFQFGRILSYQCCLSEIARADFVIVEQANKNLINYLLILLSVLGLKKFAYWGHGRNLQGKPRSWREKFKKKLIGRADWWFAYTQGAKHYVESCGFPANKITNVENSVDTLAFKNQVEAVDVEQINNLLEPYQIPNESVIGLFCGSMYPEKLIDFLLDSVTEISRQNEHFYCLFVGGGIEAHKVESFCLNHDHAFYLGPQFGMHKAIIFAASDFLINPGLVGLGILDGFAAKLPIVTTRYDGHSPEIEYLTPGDNGLVSGKTIGEFASTVVSLTLNSDLLSKLQSGAGDSSSRYSIDNMSVLFFDGIKEAIEYGVSA